MIEGSILRAGAMAVGVLGGVCLFAAPAGAGGFEPPYAEVPGHTEFSGRMIVRPRGDLPAARAAAARERLAPRVLARCDQTGEYLVAVPPLAVNEGAAGVRGAAENAMGAALLATGDYEYVTPDWRCYPEARSTNDPLMGTQWHHARLGTPAAWDLVTGSSNVTIAFVDTGIDLTHPDLAASRVSGYNSASHLAETAGGQVNDIVGHGTHVAGCAAAIGNNGVGVSGMGWAFRIMMVRATNDGWGTAFVWDICEGARWAVDHGARVVNVSYAGIETPSVQTTGAYVRSKNGLLVYAADNTSTDHSDFDWPDVLVVGAVDQNDQLAWFSSYGTAVDLVAPGVSIYSTRRWGTYEFRDGTSFASPIVAGIAGLVWSANPALSSQQVESILLSSCVDLGDPGEDNLFGRGRISAFEAARRAVGSLGPRPPTALADAAQTSGGTPVNIDVLANDYDVNGDAITFALLPDGSRSGASLSRSRGTGAGGRDEITYLPPASFSGTDTFQYVVSDSTGRSSLGSVTVEVLAHCLSDVDYSGFVNADDFDVFIGWFESQDPRADLNRDRFVSGVDFDLFIHAYVGGC